MSEKYRDYSMQLRGEVEEVIARLSKWDNAKGSMYHRNLLTRKIRTLKNTLSQIRLDAIEDWHEIQNNETNEENN